MADEPSDSQPPSQGGNGNGHGGWRPGSGRKPDPDRKNRLKEYELSLAQRRAVVAEAIEQGITPLEFMLRIMRAPIPADAPIGVQAQLLQIQTAMALGAAPYIHPKPSPVPAQSIYTAAEHAADLRATLAGMNALTGPQEPPRDEGGKP